MTDPVATPAAADPATPAAATPVTTPDPVAPTTAKASLIPDAPAVAPVEPAVTSTPDEGPEWLLYDGVKGAGKMPEWFRADKYKTVAAQAEAFTHLERRLGAFTGAPKDGKYEPPKLPEGIEGEFDMEHPVLTAFDTWAIENQVSQKGRDEMLSLFAQYEAQQVPNFVEIKQEIGEKADERINTASLWAKANLTAAEFEEFRAVMSDKNAARVFRVVESLIGKSVQPRTAKPGDDGSAASKTTLEHINEMQAKIGPDGKRLYETDAGYRNKVEKLRMDYFANQQSV